MRITVLLAAALLVGPSIASAQQVSDDSRTVYQASFFTQYAPSTALDIVRRVPAFTLEVGEQRIRGFGQAAGNVVINGARPSSKTDTLETILARIPASSVARVEVAPGDQFGSEYTGKPQVLNLVLTSTGGLSGTINATVRRDYTGHVAPEGTASALYRTGRSTFNASAGYTNSHNPEEGTDRVKALPSGGLLEFRRKFNGILDHEAFATATWEHDGGTNRSAHLNLRGAKGRFGLEQKNHVIPKIGPERDDRLTQDYGRTDFELGGDVTRPLLGGGIKLIGVATRKHQDYTDVSLNRVEHDVIGGLAQTNVSQRNETILRLVWSHADLGGWSVEAGGEGALNTLDSDVNLYLLDADGGRTRIDLPVDQARVKEWRGEIFVNGGRNLSPTLRIDLGIVYEFSRLTVSGDADAERVLTFPKPKAVVDWKKGKWHGQFSLIRTVAQLNFDDFVSAAELTNDRVDAGNPDLEPQRSWENLLTVEHPLLTDGLIKIELGYNFISMVQDRVPIEGGFDAPGNLGDGTQKFVRGTLSAPLGRLGIKGGQLDLSGTLQRTLVEDPYTHRQRTFSGSTDWAFEASFRQDFAKFGWGFTVYGQPAVTFFWRDETDTSNGIEPYVTAFAEYRPDKKTTVTFGLDNIFQVPGERRRTFFFPDRSNLSPSLSEYRERNPHITSYIRLKRSFG